MISPSLSAVLALLVVSGGPEAEEETLGDAMVHHVSDNHVLDVPGMCEGFHWNCEIDLKEIFGESLVFNVGGTEIDMTPTKHVVGLWVVGLLLFAALALAVRRRNIVPRGFYNFIELLVQFIRNEIAIPNIGKSDADRFMPYLCSAFFFILFMNLFGLVPYAPGPTANLSVTVALALFTFLITQYAAIRAQGIGGWFKHLTAGTPWPLWIVMVPVEVLGLFTKPFALTVRLFANITAGHMVILALMGLIVVLENGLVAFGTVPMALFIYGLELFVAFVQAYIFTMLSALFIGMGVVHQGHEEHSDHGSH